MPTPLFSHRNAREFVEYVKKTDVFGSSESKLYIFLAKRTPWNGDDTPPEDLDMSQSNQYSIWDQMSLLRRVTPTDIELGIRRIDWVGGKVYDQYDDTLCQKERDFYVITSQNNIYVCIDNNYNTPSIYEPTHLNESTNVEEPDGYRWKYITTISQSLIDKFIVPGYIPFQDNTIIQEATISGTIDQLEIVQPGLGYETEHTVENDNELFVFIEGDGVQYTGATLNLNVVQGSIANFSITNPGENYDYGPGVPFPVAIRQNTPSGAVQNAYGIATTDVYGQIEQIEIVIRGNGYQSGVAHVVQSSAEGFAETDFEGKIVNAQIAISKNGMNFHKARAVILSSIRPENLIQPAILRPVISPRDGFGNRQFLDLFAQYALFAIRIDTTDVLEAISFEDFRIMGLIDSPLTHETELVEESSTVDSDVYHTETRVSTFADTDPNTIAFIDSKEYVSAKVLIQATSDNGETSHTTELLITHENGTVTTTEYGTVTSPPGTPLFTLDVAMVFDDIIQIRASGTSANTTTYSVYMILMRDVSEEGTTPVLVEKPKVLDTLIGDPKYRIVLDPPDNSGFEEGETLIGETSGTLGIGASKFGSDTLRYMPNNGLYQDDGNGGFLVGEQIRGESSSTMATVVEVIQSDTKRYSGDMYHINNIRPVEFNPQQNVLLTFVLRY